MFTAGENVRVNDPSADAGGHTQSETSITVRGSNIVVSFNDANADGSGYAFSTDGGNSFTHRRIPTPPGGFNLGDGVVAHGPNGELYYATLAFTSSRQSIIGVAKSLDNGATFSTPADASTTAGNASDFQDKEWVIVDKGSSSPFRGNVYVSWTDFTASNGNFINFSRSIDGGITFSAPINLSSRDGSQAVQGSVPAVAPNGDLYVAYFDVHSGLPKIAVVKSTDGGQTFGLPVTASLLIPVGTMTGGGGVRANSFASLAIDNAGQVHAVFTAVTADKPADRGDIYYVRSSDGGASFSAAVQLNDDDTRTTQFFPSIAAAADGSLGVKWWDRRNDTVNDSLTDVYMTISRNGGTSFAKNFRITDHNWVFGPIEPGFAPGYHGDYDGIAADGNNFFVSWSDERNADPDAYFTEVPVSRNADAPDFNISARKVYDSVVAGNSVSFEFATSGNSGFAGSLSVSAAPAISGLVYSFSPSSVTSGQTTNLTITAAASTQPGTSLITVLANGGGITRKTNFRLTTLSASFPGQPPQNITKTPGFTDSRGALQIDLSGTIHHVFEDDTAVGAFGGTII